MRRAGLVLGITGSALLAWPLVASGFAYRERNRDFPVLADFNRPLSTYFVHALAGVRFQREKLPPALAGHALESHALRVVASSGSWWGLTLREPVPDWRRFQRLAVTIANPAHETLRVELRVYDRETQDDAVARFSTVLEIPPESWRTSVVPLTDVATNGGGSGVDLAHVHALMLAHQAASGTEEFYLARMWLE